MCVKKNLSAIVKSVSFVAALTTGVTTVTAVFSPVVMAAEKAPMLSSKMKPLGEAQKLMGEKKWKEALAVINEKVVPISGKSAYEETVTNDMKAYCLVQLKDTLGAAKVWENMLATNQIPADQVQPKILLLAQIYFQQGSYDKAIQYYERYLKESPNNTEAIEQLTNAYFKKGDYKSAGEHAQKLVKQAEQAKKKPDEDLLNMLRFCYFKQDNNAGHGAVLEQLLEYYPQQKYWSEMFKVVKNETNFTDREKIEYYRLKKNVGVLEQQEYNDMAELALASLDSGDAKAILEAGIANGALKADERTNRLLARAKADAAADLASLDSQAKEAAAKADGEALSKVGAAYLGHGLNDKAIAATESAIKKGGLRSVDENYIRLGAAYYNLGKKAEAVKAFQHIGENAKLAHFAKLWIIFAKK